MLNCGNSIVAWVFVLSAHKLLVYDKWYTAYEPQHDISNNVVCATSKGSDQPAQSDQSLC